MSKKPVHVSLVCSSSCTTYLASRLFPLAIPDGVSGLSSRTFFSSKLIASSSLSEKRYSSLSKSTRINSLKSASLEAISEIISDLCSVVSFIVLDLIRYCTTNIRTLELIHVLGIILRLYALHDCRITPSSFSDITLVLLPPCP